MIPKKIKKDQQQLQPKKDKRPEMTHLPLLPLPLHRQIPRKALSFKDKTDNLENWLKKIKSKDAPKEAKKAKESAEYSRPSQETKESSSAKPETIQAPTPKVPVVEKRKPGRPVKKKIIN